MSPQNNKRYSETKATSSDTPQAITDRHWQITML